MPSAWLKGARALSVMLVRTLTAVAIVAMTAGVANAQDIPRYDPETYCAKVAQISGGSSMIYNGCIDMEQTAYDGLKRAWPNVSSTTRTYCDEVGRVSGGSYSILQGCIEMETDALNTRPSFRF